MALLPQQSSSKLIPVRVDVAATPSSSADEEESGGVTRRIIDTLLIDPTCWPIPLYSPLQESVERNIQEYAHTILSDAEVQGMGRTVRHFTGRLDGLWTPESQEQVEAQLRPQIWKIVQDEILLMKNQHEGQKSSLQPISIRLFFPADGIQLHEDSIQLTWDQNVPEVSPMDLAKSLVEEYQLADDAVVDITTTILEQLYGLQIPASPLQHHPHASKRGAWKMEPKEVVAMTAQITANHRSSAPTNPNVEAKE